MNSALLTIDHLSTGYGHGRRCRTVGTALTASLPAATMTALIGSNGTGKTTLLRTVAGLLPPLSGAVCWQGRRLADFDRTTLARTIAVVLTARPAAEGLTVREVVELGRLPYTSYSGRLSADDRRWAAEAMACCGVMPLAERHLATLSDGELQRVMLAKALAQQTPLIVLDEPTAHLDFAAKMDVLLLLRRLAHEAGKTILLSSHDVEAALHLSDRLWLLSRDGLDEGTPAELAASGAIAQHFDSEVLRFDSATRRFVYAADRRD